MIMNPWPILGAAARARDNNDDCDDEDSAETRGLSGHGRGHESQSSGQRFLILGITFATGQLTRKYGGR